mgnify:CR=1 FL=1
MSISTEQYNRLLIRMNTLEELANDILTVLNKTTTASTISKVITTFETQLDDIRERLTTAEEDIENLKEDPYGEQEDS